MNLTHTLIAILSFSASVLAVEVTDYPATPYGAKDPKWRKDQSDDYARRSRGSYFPWETVFIGDSITWMWGVPASHPDKGGREVFQKIFTFQKAIIFAVSGDKIQNTLWRIKFNKELTGHPVKNIVLMIGTNNIMGRNGDSAEQVVHGIGQVVEAVKEAQPTAKILVLSMPPLCFTGKADRDMAPVKAVPMIQKLADDKRVFFLDITPFFLDKNGKTVNLRDGVHPDTHGYELMAPAIAAKLLEMNPDNPSVSKEKE